MNNARLVQLDDRGKAQMFFDDIYEKIAGSKPSCDPDCNCKKCRAKRQKRNASTQGEQMQGETQVVEREMSDTSSFDALTATNVGAEDRYTDVFPKQIIINPQVQDTANKLVWNKMLIDKLMRDRANRNDKQNISIIIIERKKRMRELKDALDNYTNCVGENYANFDDMQLQCKCRKIEVSKAVRKAKDKASGKKVDETANVIPVTKALNPEFSEGKILVPPKPEITSSATGLTGLDERADFDAPPIREVYINADGKTTLNINWGSFLIGGIVAVGAIWAIKKYNLLKGI